MYRDKRVWRICKWILGLEGLILDSLVPLFTVLFKNLWTLKFESRLHEIHRFHWEFDCDDVVIRLFPAIFIKAVENVI